MQSPAGFASFTLFAVIALTRTICAQCTLEWSSMGPQPTLAGSPLQTTLWDPDGAGPLPQRLVIGGENLTAGTVTATQVASWDGANWHGMPALGSGYVAALTVWNGQLVVGGTFTSGGLNHIALWNGTSWQALGPGVPGTVDEMTVWNGNLVVADRVGFSQSTFRTWNGATWSQLPAAPGLDSTVGMVSFQGVLVVAGNGNPTGGVLARWDGTQWLPPIMASSNLSCLAVRSFSLSSSLYVGGSFSSIGGTAAQKIATTSNITTPVWSQVGNGLASPCRSLHVRATSALATAIVATSLGGVDSVMQLVNGTWQPMGQPGSVSRVTYYAGSYHLLPVGSSAASCLRYDGATWAPVTGPGFDGEVRAVTPSGADVIVGGTFTNTPSGPIGRVARWDGTTFTALGSGIVGTSVDALCAGAGNVFVGGTFVTAGGLTANNVARWNGSAWSVLGLGCNDQVLALCRMPNGDVIAGGKFTTAGGAPCSRIARWNGSSWSSLGSGLNGDVRAIAARADGRIFVGGSFTAAGGVACANIAQWDGSAWSSLGTGLQHYVFGLAVLPNSDVIAVGDFLAAGGFPADRVARWNGAAWAAIPSASNDASHVAAVLALPNDDFVVGHGFHTPALPDEGISRWTNSSWQGLGAFAVATTTVTPLVLCLAQRLNGELVVGGRFQTVQGTVSPALATIGSTCLPQVQPFGTGCTAAGPLTLTAEALPWLGAAFRTTTTGIAANSLCIGITGFTAMSVPLAQLLAQGQPGCSLLVSPDFLTVLPIQAGNAHSSLMLANDVALLGMTFHQQTLPLEFNGTGAWIALRSSGALTATIGTL